MRNKKSEYALVKLRFMRANNLACYIDCFANTGGLIEKPSEIRRFFNVPFNKNGFKSWLDDFYTSLNNQFPKSYVEQDDELESIDIHTVCEHEGRDPNRIYRHHLMRHQPDFSGTIKHRTEYNSQLAKLKFPKLWEIYKNDHSVSFVFTDKKDAEISEEEAYANFIKAEQSRLR